MRHATESDTGSALLNLLRDPADQSAWRTFVARYGPKIAYWCRQCCLQEAAAEDVTQNVLTTLVRRLRTFTYDPQKGTFRGWLKTVTDHAVQAYVESERRNGRATGDSAVLDILQSCEAREDLHKTLADVYDLELLEAAKKRVQLRVSPRDWKIYQDLAFDGRQCAAVAEEHHLTVQAVLMAKCRVKKQLREEIQRLEKPGAEPREG
jgi:RNA polymerase sigma-70 factor (ECF subfamily)